MSTVDRVQALVMADLLGGRIPPGTWLRQHELAHRYGVSKIPVREALQRLAALGLLRFEPNRGAQLPHLTVDDAEEIFELRLELETRLLARALPRLTLVDLAQARAALRQDDVSPAEINWNFHSALYAAADRPRTLAMVEMLNAAVTPYVQIYVGPLGAAEACVREHEDILEACIERDPVAVDHLRHHLESAARLLVGGLAEGTPDTMAVG